MIRLAARQISLLLLILFFSLPATSAQVKNAPAQPQSAPIQVFFGPKAADDPESILANMLRFFDSANASIYGSAHEIDMIVVAEKLAARAAAGVDVEIVVESKW